MIVVLESSQLAVFVLLEYVMLAEQESRSGLVVTGVCEKKE